MAAPRRAFWFLNLAGAAGGCLLIVVIAACIGGGFLFITSSFKSSPVYTQAMEAARNDSRVVAALGTPIESGWFITGSTSEQGLSGDANLVIPISGPRKGATLYASARKANGVWQFYTLAVQVDGQSDAFILEK